MKSFKMSFLLAIFKFCMTNHLFKYFCKRYSNQQCNLLNLVKKQRKICSLISTTAFLKACLVECLLSKFVKIQIKKLRTRLNPNIEHAFITDEIKKNCSLIVFLKRKSCSVWCKAMEFLSFFDLIWLCRYIASIDQHKEKENEIKNRHNVALL